MTLRHSAPPRPPAPHERGFGDAHEATGVLALTEADLEAIGDRVRALRSTAGRAGARMSQEQLAKAAGIGLATIRRLESGKSCRVTTYARLGRVLRLQPGWWTQSAEAGVPRGRSSAEAIDDAFETVAREASIDATVLAYCHDLLTSALDPALGAALSLHVELARDNLRSIIRLKAGTMPPNGRTG